MTDRLKGALRFVHHEAAGAVLLLVSAIIALILANSTLSPLYAGLLDTPVTIRVGALAIDKPLLLWINDGLMAIFFFLVGLEIKRELLYGELSTLKQATLPLAGAIGGIIIPALIYAWINQDDARALDGWAIPTATDIAFAVGVLALLGSRIPAALKVFLLALAIIDDLGAIIIIALFYTAKLSPDALFYAAIGIAALVLLNRRGVTRVAAYVLAGLFVWICVLKSGVHATLAGVITALAVPMAAPTAGKAPGPADQLQDSLHPWVAFGVLPLFAFANAGVALDGVSVSKLLEPIPSGIALGLIFGKVTGIFLFSVAAISLGIASRPAGVSWTHLFGAALLGGIGFTMSLFIGTLAFPEPWYAADVRIGVLAGSLVSALAGYIVLARTSPLPVAVQTGKTVAKTAKKALSQTTMRTKVQGGN